MSLLIEERIEHTVRLRLNRPDALNAMSRELLALLETRIQALSVDPAIRALILTGSGRSFCTGADLKERASMSPPEVRDFLIRVGHIFQAIESFPCPVICGINGFALGGGLELALACDFRIAQTDALLGLTETSLGIIPGAGGTQRLPRLIGVSRAKALIFTARKVGASEALSMGLVDSVVNAEKLDEACVELASSISKNAPIAVRSAKFAINAGANVDLSTGLAIERNAYEITIPTKDRIEALHAFREKRAARFTGE